MDAPMPSIETAAHVALVVAVVAALRKRVPAIDGWIAIVVAAVVSVLVVLPTWSFVPVEARSAILVALYSVGGVSIVQQLRDRTS